MTAAGRPKLDQSAFEIASRIRARREALGLSGAVAACRVGQSRGTYLAWEKQFGPQSQSRHLAKLCEALSISEAALTGEELHPLADGSDNGLFSNPRPAAHLSISQLELFGRRAKARRKELNLSLHEMALRIGISAATLNVLETSITSNIKQARIDAWEAALQVLRGWLLNLDVEIPKPSPVVINTGDSLTAADEIRKIGCWIARKHGKKTTDIRHLSPSEVRSAEIFALRYGVAGEDAATLQSIGDMLGLTRERVRQIVEKMLERLQSSVIVVTPIVDAVFSDLLTKLPASVVNIDKDFRDRLGESLSILSLDRFSREILGKGCIQITERPSGMTKAWEKAVINPSTHNEAKLRAIRNSAFDMIRSCGGAQINWVAGTASWECGEIVTAQEILQACQMIAGFNWLVEEDGWLWFGETTPADNRVLQQSRKMLAVAGRRLDAEDIQQGLSRGRRYHYDPNRPRPVLIEPPLTVVVAVLSQVPWLKVIQSDDFVADPAIRVEDVLSDSELEIYQLMLSAGGAMSRYDIKRSMSGMFSDVSLAVNLDNSPIFSRLDTGVFTLRGRQLSLTSIQRAMESVGGPSSAGKLEVHTIDGSVSFTFSITEYQARNKFVDVPPNVLPYLNDGEYAVEGFDTKARYTAGRTYHRIYKLIQKMLSIGFCTGDTATIQIFTREKTIRILKKHPFVANVEKKHGDDGQGKSEADVFLTTDNLSADFPVSCDENNLS